MIIVTTLHDKDDVIKVKNIIDKSISSISDSSNSDMVDR